MASKLSSACMMRQLCNLYVMKYAGHFCCLNSEPQSSQLWLDIATTAAAMLQPANSSRVAVILACTTHKQCNTGVTVTVCLAGHLKG